VNDRVFEGIFPCGIVYADRTREKGGDYARLAFLPYRSLELDWEPGCPPELRQAIQARAARIQVQRGKSFQVSTCGQTVMLGVAP